MKTLLQKQYCILRLPAVYQPGRLGPGFIDKIYASDASSEPLNINSNNLFNNMISVSSLINFLSSLLQLNELPGYLGSLGTCNPLTLGFICSLLQEFKDIPLPCIYNPALTQESTYNTSAAVDYGFTPEDTLVFIGFFYSS
jgi:hypothetical protein